MIDWAFISLLEGACHLAGYIPEESDTPNSGVTVATGVDLGHRRVSILYGAGLSVDVLDEVAIYCGVTGVKAKKLLEERPLLLSLSQARQLDDCVRRVFEVRLRKMWGAHSDIPWANVPDPIKTVVMSVGWQYGAPWRRTPRFWGFATKGLWFSVVSELRNFRDDYPSRRNAEAEYLLERLNEGVTT